VLRLSLATFAERWNLFVGAAVTVCLGVALVQSSLLILISAATLPIPDGLDAATRAQLIDGSSTAVALSALTLGFSAFLAVFIVGSTFAFTVAQRRRDLALLRLVGTGRGGMRRLLVGEALVLGLIGSAAGVPAGLAAIRFQSGLLIDMGLLPAGFTPEFRIWILGVGFGVGVGVALAGVLVAAYRAARVRPLEALRDPGAAGTVMTPARWVVGGVFAAGAVSLIVLSPIGGPAGGQALAANAALCMAVALSALSPLLVPAIGALVPTRGPIGELAVAALRDGVRRGAATAAPVIVLVGLVLAQGGVLTSVGAAGADQLRRGTAGDLVLDARGPVGARVAEVPGVAWASTEIQVPLTVTTRSGDGDEVEVEQDIGSALVVDPAAYPLAHPGSDAVAGLTGRAVAAGPGSGGGSPGDRIEVRIGDTDLGEVPIEAGVTDVITGGADLLVPAALVPAPELADAKSRTLLALALDADREQVLTRLAAIGAVVPVADLLAERAATDSAGQLAVFIVLMGLGGLYALLGVINAVVVGAAPRPAEFAVNRMAGLTRGQVLGAALIESAAVTTTGLVLGLVAAGASWLGVLGNTFAVTGVATLAVPWLLVLGLFVGLYLVTGTTSLLSTLAATRRAPVALLGARG
jgi:putative ABC transport system permease protein